MTNQIFGSLYNEGVYPSDWLKHEVDIQISRAYGTIPAGTTFDAGAGAVAQIPSGTVFGRVTATGEYVPCDLGAADGSEVPAAILFNQVDVPAATSLVAVLVVKDAIVIQDKMSFHTSFTTQALKDTAFADLEANNGIVQRPFA